MKPFKDVLFEKNISTCKNIKYVKKFIYKKKRLQCSNILN